MTPAHPPGRSSAAGALDGTPWAEAIARWLLHWSRTAPPPAVLRAAARQTLDAVACAVGAVEHEAAMAVRRAVRTMDASGPCSLVLQHDPVPVLEAILHNGTLIRALDCNDIFFRYGPLGHPSDTLAVPLAVAEQRHATGAAYLRAVAVGYELYWRWQEHVLAAAGEGSPWDYTAASGLVAAAMAGLLLRLDAEALARALAIAAVQGCAVRQVRTGQISMAKASVGAIGAQAGAVAALLAAAGMTGPVQALEGESGLLRALGVRATEQLCGSLVRDIDEWHILEVSSKAYPAIGTSQGAITAALEIVQTHDVRSADIERVEVRLADTATTRRHLADVTRVSPQTRESADHSIPFLVAVALEDRALGLEQFRDMRWLRPATRALIRRVTQTLDGSLNQYSRSSYPAVVTVTARDGRSFRSEVLKVPGSCENPLSDHELVGKLRRLANSGLSSSWCEQLAGRLLGLEDEPDVSAALPLLRSADR
jgi:2-methylcitrate dehydratase